MTDRGSVRDVIVRVLKRYPFVADVDMPDYMLAALAEAGYRIEPDNGWEWGLYSSDHEAVVTEDDDHNIFTEGTARESVSPGWVLVRRHPATEWESSE